MMGTRDLVDRLRTKGLDKVESEFIELRHLEPSDPWLRKLLSSVNMLIYVSGREGTILISSIAFSFFVSIFPMIVLLLTLANLLELSQLRETIFDSLTGFFPISQDFIVRNLKIYTREIGPPQVISVVLIAWAGSAFFFALEAGLDSAYRVVKPRNFVSSQVLGTGMALLAGLVVFGAIAAVGWVNELAQDLPRVRGPLQDGISSLVSFAAAWFIFWTLYYYLPNLKRRFGGVLLTSVFAALAWLLTSAVFREFSAAWSLKSIYGPFYVSMTLLLWAYASGCILLGAARLEADGFFGDWRVRPSRRRSGKGKSHDLDLSRELSSERQDPVEERKEEI